MFEYAVRYDGNSESDCFLSKKKIYVNILSDKFEMYLYEDWLLILSCEWKMQRYGISGRVLRSLIFLPRN